MKLSMLTIIVIIGINILQTSVKAKEEKKIYPLDNLYREAQRNFRSSNYHGALELFKVYISKSKNTTYKRERLFWAINQVGKILLRFKNDPDNAISFFKSIKIDKRLNEAEEDCIDEWISAAREWKKLGKLPKNIKTPDALYMLGMKYYKIAYTKAKYPLDEAASASFHIAASYLVPFVVNFDNDKRIGEVLYTMGDIRSRSWRDKEYWSPNFYFKEVIRRFPHTKLSQKSWKALNDEIHFAYSGSSGDNTPTSLLEELKVLKVIATPKTKTKKNLKNTK